MANQLARKPAINKPAGPMLVLEERLERVGTVYKCLNDVISRMK